MPANLNNEQQEQNINVTNENTGRVLGTRDIPDDFSIQEAVVSILDKGGDEPLLNEYQLELTESVHTYLHNHIKRCFTGDKLRFGLFNPQVNGVKNIANKILRNEEDIVTASKEISTRLFNIMKNDDGVESCDLATITIATTKGSMLCILKLDYAKNFMHQVDFLEEKISIGITPVKTGLPNTGIQKAAFIKANDDDGFDLYYLDEIRKTKDSDDYNVHYWTNNFLNCAEITNSKSTTLDFVKASESWIRATKHETAKESEEIRSAIREKLLEADSVSINELADEIFETDIEKAESFKTYMSSLNFEDEVVVDKPTAVKKLSKIKIKIDKEITLSIDRESYNDNSKFEIIENLDGSINMVIKNITSYVEK